MHIATIDLQTIPPKTRIMLRRSIGKDIASAGNAMGYFYAIKPPQITPYQEEALFACLTMACQWNETDRSTTLSLAQCLRTLVAAEKLNKNSIDRTMQTILDCEWNPEHGNLLGIKLSRLVKQIRTKGMDTPDFEQLYYDLKNWNHPDKFIQKQWARDYFTTTKIEEDETDAV
ncbi:MAG: type I-E CRISPR-associated protein Cse2/CasB [Faecalibacterium sp.]